jgi:hypothetical protein
MSEILRSSFSKKIIPLLCQGEGLHMIVLSLGISGLLAFLVSILPTIGLKIS